MIQYERKHKRKRTAEWKLPLIFGTTPKNHCRVTCAWEPPVHVPKEQNGLARLKSANECRLKSDRRCRSMKINLYFGRSSFKPAWRMHACIVHEPVKPLTRTSDALSSRFRSICGLSSIADFNSDRKRGPRIDVVHMQTDVRANLHSAHIGREGSRVDANTYECPRLLPHLRDLYVPTGIPAPTNFVGIGIKVIRDIRVVL